jgi:hypothetical protein
MNQLISYLAVIGTIILSITSTIAVSQGHKFLAAAGFIMAFMISGVAMDEYRVEAERNRK